MQNKYVLVVDRNAAHGTLMRRDNAAQLASANYRTAQKLEEEIKGAHFHKMAGKLCHADTRASLRTTFLLPCQQRMLFLPTHTAA